MSVMNKLSNMFKMGDDVDDEYDDYEDPDWVRKYIKLRWKETT